MRSFRRSYLASRSFEYLPPALNSNLIFIVMASNETNDISKTDPVRYVRWDAPGVVKIPPGEAEDIQAVAEMINHMQRVQFKNHRHMYSGEYC